MRSTEQAPGDGDGDERTGVAPAHHVALERQPEAIPESVGASPGPSQIHDQTVCGASTTHQLRVRSLIAQRAVARGGACRQSSVREVFGVSVGN